jgi:tRNA/tmRNA/rRNA uracil-C5-methylase (TrmA/RlmC/RlmD family)
MEKPQEVLMLLLDKTTSRIDQEIVRKISLEFSCNLSTMTKDLRSYSKKEYNKLYDLSALSMASKRLF